MKKRILIVEDDAVLARVLQDNLSFEGFEAEWVEDGHAAAERARQFVPDLVLLDIMLPGPNGFELCETLRQGGRTAIIMLTARDRKSDKLHGLDVGADDYVTKPFDLEELLARIRAVLRRARPTVMTVTLGDVMIDFGSFKAVRRGRSLHLTRREFEILKYLAERQDRVVFRAELLQEVWGYQQAPSTRSVDNAIARLRKKIEPTAHRPRFIHMGYGDGYYLTPDRSDAPKGTGD